MKNLKIEERDIILDLYIQKVNYTSDISDTLKIEWVRGKLSTYWISRNEKDTN